MQSIDLLRKNPEVLKEDLKKRRQNHLLELVDEARQKDDSWRKIKQEEDELRHKRNEISSKINKTKKEGGDIQPLIEKAKEYPQRIEQLQQRRENLKAERDRLLRRLPNQTHNSVPFGESDEDNVPVKHWGEPREPDFELLPHNRLAEKLGVADFERSAKISGSGFYFLTGDLGLLNQALIQFVTHQLVRKDYTYQEPPLMLRREAYETGVSMEDFEEVMYELKDEDAYLIATSEAPMLSQFKDETLSEDDLPIKRCAYSMCFRKEVGSHGVDTKGLYRTHQFNKVEQIIVSKPENSWKYHEELQENAERIHRQLGLPYRVVNCCTGDLGNFAAKKFDIEAWMPRQDAYKETCSNSNYTDYQARRANIKMHRKETNEYIHPHTLNCTGVATSRVMVAILENYQREDGTVEVPEVLRPYMFGKKVIRPQ
jgi:seryl-tRNA synthetase